MGGEISTEGDIYSYGIVLLEMLTRKRPTNEEFSDGLTLRKYVEASLSRTQDILQPGLTSVMGDQFADQIPNLQECNIFAMKDICALRLFKFGILCSAESPKEIRMHETSMLALLYQHSCCCSSIAMPCIFNNQHATIALLDCMSSR